MRDGLRALRIKMGWPHSIGSRGGIAVMDELISGKAFDKDAFMRLAALGKQAFEENFFVPLEADEQVQIMLACCNALRCYFKRLYGFVPCAQHVYRVDRYAYMDEEDDLAALITVANRLPQFIEGDPYHNIAYILRVNISHFLGKDEPQI